MAPTGTMRAVFYQGARTFTPGKTAIPAAGPGEALLRVLRVGICGTDLHIFQGHLDNRVPHGGIIGHETFAEVVEAPAGSGFTAGDRVVVEPVRFCGTCRACRIGASYICYNLKVLGVDLPGGMQEYWPVPVDRLIKVPDSLADDHAAVIEPLAVATHDVTRAGVKTGDAVLVFGGGPIGCLIALVCRHRGARVAVVEINPFRVEMLRRLGSRGRRARGRSGPLRDRVDRRRRRRRRLRGHRPSGRRQGDHRGRPGLGDDQHRRHPLGAHAGEPPPVLRARAQPPREPALHASRLGGGDPPRGERRRSARAPRQPRHPARVPPGGHGDGARRRPGHEGARQRDGLTPTYSRAASR